jgi:hypothetical protein
MLPHDMSFWGIVVRQPLFLFTSRIGRPIGAGYLEFARRQYPRSMGLLVRAPGIGRRAAFSSIERR